MGPEYEGDCGGRGKGLCFPSLLCAFSGQASSYGRAWASSCVPVLPLMLAVLTLREEESLSLRGDRLFSRSGGDHRALRGSGGTPSPLLLAAGPLTLRLPAPGSAPEIPSLLLLPLGPPSQSPASTSEGIRIGVRLPRSHASQTGAGVRMPWRVL